MSLNGTTLPSVRPDQLGYPDGSIIVNVVNESNSLYLETESLNFHHSKFIL